jgi:hypothetical protein
MSFDEDNFLNNLETPEAPLPEERSNRTFQLILGIIAGLVFLTLACLAVWFLFLGPNSASKRDAQRAAIETQNAQVALQLTSTAEALLWTPTSPPTATFTATLLPQLNTPVSSPTPVVALNSPTADLSALSTMLAAQTQLAAAMTATMSAELAQGTRGIGGAATQMPATGFFDEVGLPSMIVLAVTLVIVIFLARRLRKAPR